MLSQADGDLIQKVSAVVNLSTNENNFDLLDYISVKYTSEINSTITTYDSNSLKIAKLELFNQANKIIEYIKLSVQAADLYLKSDKEYTGYVFYKHNNDNMMKESFFGKKIDLQLSLKSKDYNNPNDKIEVAIAIFNVAKIAKISGRILADEVKGNLYYSDDKVTDNYIEDSISDLYLFYYIGIPLISLFVIAIIITIIVICFKKKKKSDEKGGSSKKLNTVSKGSENNITNPNDNGGSNLTPMIHPSQIVYGMPNDKNMPYPIMYMVPPPINQNGNNPNQLMPGSMFSGSGSFQPINMTCGSLDPNSNISGGGISGMPLNPNSQYKQSHEFVGAPVENNLKMFSVEELPGEDNVPMFEVNVNNVDKYTPGQKYQG